MARARYIGIIVALLLLLCCCKQRTDGESLSTEPIGFTKEGQLQFFRVDSLMQTMDIEFAETDYEVEIGLMYRQSMAADQGMLFIFPDVALHSFYMKNTAIALDIIFIDEAQQIASFQKNAQPFDERSLPSQVPVKYVLEINAGLADQWGLQIGDRMVFDKY
ncbi:MAG: DUF192 domain-containing protein [Bacteroidota bacterium]